MRAKTSFEVRDIVPGQMPLGKRIEAAKPYKINVFVGFW
jgi:hypothetical protein